MNADVATADPTASRMTIVTRGDDATLEQVVKQLNKLADIEGGDFRDGEYVVEFGWLVKVSVDSKTRAEVMQITDIFGQIVDVQPNPYDRSHRQRRVKIEIPRFNEKLCVGGFDADRKVACRGNSVTLETNNWNTKNMAIINFGGTKEKVITRKEFR